MAITLEDGSIVTGANTYATEDMADTYFEDRASTDWDTATGDKEGALIRATASLDAMYRLSYPGYRVAGRDQELEWPRTAAYDYEELLIDEESIPTEIIQATCELALREVLSPGSTQPDLERGGMIRSVRAGSVAVEYGGSQATT